MPPAPSQPNLRAILFTRAGAALQVIVVAVAIFLLPGGAWLSPVLLALIVAALLWLAGDGLRAVGFGRPTRPAFWWLSTSLLVGLVWQYAASGFIVPFIGQAFGAPAPVPASAGPPLPSGAFGYALSILVFGLFHPLAKALAYRGFLLNRLEHLFGPSLAGVVFSFVLASLLFGLGNAYQGWPGLLVNTLTGAVFNALYYWTRRNVWPSVFAHSFYNLAALTLLILGRS